MPKLISRQKYVPGGFKFYQPEIKFTAPANASFDIIVQAIIAARKANPHLLQKHGWPTEYNAVADELDFFNAKICEQMGWNDYITGSGGGGVPFPQHLPQAHPSPSLRKVVAGAKALVKWLASGADAVPAELANKRGETCAACPLNERGSWERFFTVPVSEAIRGALNQRQGMKLSTTSDEKLGVCTACLCPIKLKVHLKLSEILPELSAEARGNLDKACWITSEALSK